MIRKVSIWIKWFANPLRSSDLNQMIPNPLQSPDLNQMICEPPPKSQSESKDSQTRSRSKSNDSRTRSALLIWTKRFVNPLQSPYLKQMIHKPAPKSRSESNDSWSMFRSSDPNQMICEPAPKFWSKSNDSRTSSVVPIKFKWYELWSPDLNQMICELPSEVPVGI